LRSERYEVEEERYDDLRGLGEPELPASDGAPGSYAELGARRREAFAYVDLAPAVLDFEAEARARQLAATPSLADSEVALLFD